MVTPIAIIKNTTTQIIAIGSFFRRIRKNTHNPMGKYLGFENVKKCYLDHHFDRGDEGAEEKMKGAVFFHHLDTPIIEVAADGKTARGAWWSPGHETFPRGDREPGQGAIWAWSKYGADFIKEDDGWKIWRIRIYPMF